MVLAMLAVAQLMAVFDATVVNIALPSAHRALHFTDENYQWIMTAYETGLVQPAESSACDTDTAHMEERLSSEQR